MTGGRRPRLRRVGQRGGQGPCRERAPALPGRQTSARSTASPAAVWPRVDAGSGALDGDVDVAFTVPRQGNEPRVETIAVTPDGTTLVAGGNFTVAGGQPRWQVALVDVGSRPGPGARLADRPLRRPRPGPVPLRRPPSTAIPATSTSPPTAPTSWSSPPAPTPAGGRCATPPAGGRSRPGAAACSRPGPTTAAATASPPWPSPAPAVYVGGHSRWLNNPKSDGSNQTASPGPGSVSREGIAALDPVSGLPLPWNPGRDRGEGAWAIASTPDGLWVGSDTDKIGGWTAPGCEGCEFHQKLAFFPLAGGAAPAVPQPAGLPGDLSASARAGLVKRSFDGAALGAPAPLGTGGDGARVRGAFWLGGRLYEGRDDGRLLRWSYDGTTFGSPAEVDLRGLPPSHQNHNAIVFGFPVAERDRHVLRQRPPLLHRRPATGGSTTATSSASRTSPTTSSAPRSSWPAATATGSTGAGSRGMTAAGGAHLLVGGRRPAPGRLRRRAAPAGHRDDRRPGRQPRRPGPVPPSARRRCAAPAGRARARPDGRSAAAADRSGRLLDGRRPGPGVGLRRGRRTSATAAPRPGSGSRPSTSSRRRPGGATGSSTTTAGSSASATPATSAVSTAAPWPRARR